MQQTLKVFQKRLTNLTVRNKSLLLLKLVRSQFMDFHDLDFANNKPSFHLIEQLIARKERIQLCSTLDARDGMGNAASAQLRQIHRNNRLIEQERGAKDLYVGYPFIQGKMLDDTPIRCPLLFFPVELYPQDNQWWLKLRSDVPIGFNKTLLLAFSHYNHVTFDDALLEQDFDDAPKESVAFRTELYRLLEQSPLEINFNQKTFEDKLVPFTDFAKGAFLESHKTGELKVMPEAVLGIFPQAGSFLEPDYETLLKKDPIPDLESLFMPPQGQDEYSDVKEEKIVAPYPLDSSQEEALKAVKSGRSIVVQGPPGSGKSQLICNLIADAMASHKNVLVVCQKKAALDVVFARLLEKNYAGFAAILHDFQNDRRELYEKIDKQIREIDYYIQENNSLDTIYIERNFSRWSREIEQLVEEFNDFHTALYNTQECGLSAKELYLTSDLNKPHLMLRQEYAHFHFQNHASFLQKIKAYSQYAKKLESANHPWRERVSFAHLGIAEMQQIEAIIKEVPVFVHELSAKVEQAIQMKPSLSDCEWLNSRREEFERMLELLQDGQVYHYFRNHLHHQTSDRIWLANRKNIMHNCFGTLGIERTLAQPEVIKAVHVAQEALKSLQRWYQKMRWKFFSKDKKWLDDLLAANGLTFSEEGLQALLTKLDNRLNLEHNLAGLLGYPWLIDMPEARDRNLLDDWMDKHIRALDAKAIYQSLRNGIKFLDIDRLSFDELYKTIQHLLGLVEEVPTRKAHWQQFLLPKQITELTENNATEGKLLRSLASDFDMLCEFDKLKLTLHEAEKDVLKKLLGEIENPDPEKWIALFDNSIRITWLNHLEAKYPILRSVSSQKLAQMEEQLQTAIEEKRRLCEDIVLLKARERTYQDLEHNRLNNRVTYRDLQHQVNKKRNIWPIRKLMQEHSKEVFNLVPCWLASPETVSAMFPFEEWFDLVIFDEASQCFAEKGIPAMYRGKQVVIVGDDKQLAPYDLYQPRWEEEWDDDPVLEIDSLLDLGARYLPQIPLTGHYRSRTPDLIDFSNAYFYQGKLRILPKYEEMVRDEPAIKYHLIENGLWEKNRNRPEAEAVVRLVSDLLAKGEKNIGIISFNFHQQELIQDLLDASGLNLPPNLFVKNIENVQGDERDVVIFSVGYAPTASGRINVQFGPLGLAKGENRLNVAITRAKNNIHVISSILPSQLNVEESKNDGPRLLKAYLHYAWEVSNGRYRPLPKPEKKYHVQWYLKQKIKETFGNSIILREDLPFADLTVLDDTYKGLILTDDDMYFQATSMKEPHAYTPLLLKERGWKHKRFYSRTFWKDHIEFHDEIWRFAGSERG